MQQSLVCSTTIDKLLRSGLTTSYSALMLLAVDNDVLVVC